MSHRRAPLNSALRLSGVSLALALVLAACVPAPAAPTPAAPATSAPATTAPATTAPATTAPATTAPATSAPPTTTTTADRAPVLGTFTVTSGPVMAPALIVFSWSASDLDGDPLTCSIDADNNTTPDITINNCQVPGSRTFSFTGVGTYTSTMTVSDGSLTDVRQTSLSVVANPNAEPYNIVVRPVVSGSSLMTPQLLAIFDTAAARWSSIIAQGVPALSFGSNTPGCLPGAAPLPTTVDDLVIDVDIAPIDGTNGILGQAGPCYYSNTDGLPRAGDMKFDSADVAGMSTALFTDVVFHEMGHVLGFGTLWNVGARTLLTGGGGADPRFVGPRATAEYSRLGGTRAVPVENTGGAGTADAHWRETVFGSELMTGFVSGTPNPLSAVTIASLGDMGYQVDISQADAYNLPGLPALRLFGQPSTASLPPMVVHGPLRGL